MILWGIVCGALIGWAAADFEEFGVLLGAVPGLLMALWLRHAVRSEIAGVLAKQVHVAPATAPVAAPVAVAAMQPDRPLAAAPLAEAPGEVVPPSARPIQRASAKPVEPAEPEVERFNPLAATFTAARNWLLGGNTIVRVGLIILFIGLAFLARYAAQHSLFPIELRLAAIVGAGIALLVVGFSRRHVRPDFALALQGTGVAAIYLTVFAATRLYDVIPPLPGFGVMIVVCALGCALALYQNAQSLAVASFLGGFAVPVLLSTGEGSSVVLFSYYTLLNLAVLFIAERRAWRMVNLVGFFATFGVATVWGVLRYEPSQYAMAQPFLIAFVLIYIVAAMLYARNARAQVAAGTGKLSSVVDSTLLFGPALAGFGLQVGLVRHLEFGSAFSALGFGAVYLALAMYARRRGYEQNQLLRECLIAIGVGFVTVAIPLALGARWTSSAWALEGAAAFYVGMRQARWMPRLFGLILQAVAALVFVETLHGPAVGLPFANAAFMAAALIALPLIATSWWLRGDLPHSGSRFAAMYAVAESKLSAPAFLAGFALAWLALSLEAVRQIPPLEIGLQPTDVFSDGIQRMLVMLAFVTSAAVAFVAGRKLDWNVAKWPARVTLLPIVLALLAQISDDCHVLITPDWALWAIAFGLHYWLLWSADRDPDSVPGWQRAMHVGSVWAVTLWLSDCLWLGIERGRLWDTSWAGVVMLLSVTAMLALLTAAATRGQKRWPLNRHAVGYYWIAAVPLALLVFGGILITALIDPGRADPLPYIPLFNPLELTLGIGLGALVLWRRMLVAKAPTGSDPITSRAALGVLALLVFVVVNTVWLRIAHHFLGVAWTPEAMGGSFVVQTGLAILWTVLALALMIVAHRRLQRSLWLVGAALLALTVGKLLLVDLANSGGGERVVTFIAVGVLMLVVGYFAPLPPAKPEPAPALEPVPAT